MTGQEWLGVILVYSLALWVVLSGLDDLFLQSAYVWLRFRGVRVLREPSERELARVRQKRIAVLVPMWHEDGVARHMLEHNLAAVRYAAWDFFVGVYPNDPRTAEAVEAVAARFANVHLAMCPHPGPTSKADCLNWIYREVAGYESRGGERFEAVVIHDAEDLIHPESLRLINYYLENYDMVQVPVLPLATPPGEFTHGLYCDEFAEYQSKDIPVRQYLGGFIASNGVGTGFSREVLEALRENGRGIFDPDSLTEDYDAGFRIHAMGRPQVFIPIRHDAAGPVATREYFPRSFAAAVRQRTRWVMGISLQGWERHGWRAPARQWYWLWRDRKGLLGNLLTPLMNVLLFWGAAEWLWGLSGEGHLVGTIWHYPGMPEFCACMMGISALQLTIRTDCARRLYGARFAALAPVRAFFGNLVNCLATLQALERYFAAKLRGVPLEWLKTDHLYPARAALLAHKRRLGEILVSVGHLRQAELEAALGACRPGERLGEYLVRTGRITENQLYRALSTQQSVPLATPDEVFAPALVPLPEALARKWSVVPVAMLPGQLCVAGPELPSEEMTWELKPYCPGELRFQLITPTHYRKLVQRYLSAEASLRQVL